MTWPSTVLLSPHVMHEDLKCCSKAYHVDQFMPEYRHWAAYQCQLPSHKLHLVLSQIIWSKWRIFLLNHRTLFHFRITWSQMQNCHDRRMIRNISTNKMLQQQQQQMLIKKKDRGGETQELTLLIIANNLCSNFGMLCLLFLEQHLSLLTLLTCPVDIFRNAVFILRATRKGPCMEARLDQSEFIIQQS